MDNGEENHADVNEENHPDGDDASSHALPAADRYRSQKAQTNLPFIEKLRLPIYREKAGHTVCICLAFIMLGWIEALFGPTLPDLQAIVNVPLHTASWLFTATSSGFLLGSILAGVLYDRCNKLLLLLGSLLGAAGATVAIPWCERFYLMVIVKFVCGMLIAGLDTGGNSEVVRTWGQDVGPYMQALHFCFALGGMLAPSVAAPFLSESRDGKFKLNHTLAGNHRDNVTTFHSASDFINNNVSTSLSDDILNFPMSLNEDDRHVMGRYTDSQITYTSPPTVVSIAQAFASGVGYLRNETEFENGSRLLTQDAIDLVTESNVHAAYLITAILTAFTAFPFVITYYMKRGEKHESSRVATINEDPTNFKDVPIPTKMLILSLLSSMMFVYCGTEDTFAGLLMTFCISQLGWTKSEGSHMTTIYWACFGFTRLGAIFFVRYVRTSTLLYVFSVLMVVTFSCFLVSTMFDVAPLIWVSAGSAGVAMSVVFPATFTWTNEKIVVVSGRISAMFLTSGSLGIMIVPLLFGYMMDRFSSMWFIYLLLGQSLVWMVLYTCTVMVTRCVLRPRPIEFDIAAEEEEMVPIGDL